MSNRLFGYKGTALRVDLTRRLVQKEPLSPDLRERFIGGRGVNMKFLFDEVPPSCDPLGPENKIFFGVGPLSGTNVSGSQRVSVSAKSPLTGLLGDSNCGGNLGAELKYAGYDLLIIEGRADKPVYLWIKDDDVQIRDAGHIWGMTTFETRTTIEREVGDPDACLAMIGPAGENQVRFANIIMELGRAAGRTGMGAVLGSKNLKAVAVRGSQGVPVADARALRSLVEENNQKWLTGAGGLPYAVIAAIGVNVGWTSMQVNGSLATHNFQRGSFETDMLAELQRGYVRKQKACMSCTLGCDHSYIVKTGPYAGTYGEGLELVHIGEAPKIGVHDMELMLRIGMVTDAYGMDIMETTAMIAFAMECWQRGILNQNDTDGLTLDWGNAEAILTLHDRIARRQGLGAILAEGLKRAPGIIGRGAEAYAMDAKGQVILGRNPRASKGWGLAYAVSSRGGCHVRAFVPEGYFGLDQEELAPIWPSDALAVVKDYKNPTDPLREEGKAELVKFYEDLRAFQDSMEVCRFSLYNGVVDSKDQSLSELMARYFNAVTGSRLSGQDVLQTGERIINLERAFNLRAGLTPEDDRLPDRMLKEPMPDGGAKGEVVHLAPMLDRYYELRGWDRASGRPGNDKLKELNLYDLSGRF